MTAIGFGAGFSHATGGGRAFDFSGGLLPVGAMLTRASVATRIDAGGALASEAAHVARFDHDPVTHAVRGLLIEAAATNPFVASRDLSAAAWARTGTTTTATTMIETVTSGVHGIAQQPGFTAGTPYCLSAIARDGAGAKRYLILFFSATAFGTALSAKFDLATGVLVFASPGVTASAVSAPGGRWLCAASAVATVTVAPATANVMIRMSDAGGSASSYTGDGASAVEVGDCQIETGTVATSRIVTGATAEARAADVLTLDWAGRGLADGERTVRYSFDDGSTQDVATTIAGGMATVPVTLARARLRRVVSLF